MSFVDENPRGAVAFGVCLAFVLISLSVVLLRLFTRVHIVQKPAVDDALMCGAWLFSLATFITIALQIRYGMGRHLDTLTGSDIIKFQKSFYFSIWLYNVALLLIKLSIIFQYRNIFVTKWFQIAAKVITGVVAVYGLWAVFGFVFICWPIESFWDTSIKGRCMNVWSIYYANAAMNIVTDFAIILLPMPLLKNLHLPVRQRIALMLIFAVGLLACAISFVRLYYLRKINTTADWSYVNIILSTWSELEVNVGIICGSLPSLKAFVSRFFPRFFGHTSRGASRYRSNTPARPTRDGGSHPLGSINHNRHNSAMKTESVENFAKDANGRSFAHETIIESHAVGEDDKISLEGRHGSPERLNDWNINVVKSFSMMSK